jgi:hypothetical protein
MTARWITADEGAFRFGILRAHIIELSSGLKWQAGKTCDDAPTFDAEKFAKLKGLKEKQETFAARQFQRKWKLSHILPTAWERLDDETFA